ncbi:hypothetical protein LTR35_001310 [Friedmanniomyces endolithicus]|nr:hypothetical protein LTR35_001310 [Friedmanniomyces endolithicus]KAK0296442.1 hypothetical protein LTS00_004767 [Friedmanniomyces endolithicus]KAK1018547.1 hypothetical protein LTR54_001434 [Friedmanniomyces endolithicus]
MDFRKLARLMPDHPSNTTNLTSLTDLPPTILEALIPGYSLISRYALAYLGFDISLFVTLGVILLALTKASSYLWSQLSRAFTHLCMSSVYIDEHDDLFDMVMGWLAAHQETTSRSRRMRAKTQRGGAGGGKGDEAYDAAADDALDANGMFNFNKWSARTPPRFEPYYGRQFVWQGGRVFWFRRARRPNEGGQRLQVSWGNAPEDDIIELDCVGRSIEPIKELLKTVRVWSLNRTSGTTTIRHPTPKDRARFGGTWSKTSSRPSRPMDTVILDAEQKGMIIRDMNEYLHPASPKWYATPGIPYRRGYLFHGPPGTGKTSLSFALAGIFGLEIYAISLQEPTLTEGDLMQLFNGLPRRCIVLLEDVDAAGLLRDGLSDADGGSKKKQKKKEKKEEIESEEKADEKKQDPTEPSKKDEDFTLKDLARELKAVTAPPRRGGGGGNRGKDSDGQSTVGISLSGLLNAIDGVATHEGRVLIMTTNHPEKLDAALVRPGRVDRKVEFRLAMKEQVRELFVRMYAASDEVPEPGLISGEAAVGNGSLKPSGKPGSQQANGHAKGPGAAHEEDELAHLTRPELEELASEFAGRVPDDQFTPAEVQNLLMRHKKEPRVALAKVDEWVKVTMEEKEEEEAGNDEEEKEGDVGE